MRVSKGFLAALGAAAVVAAASSVKASLVTVGDPFPSDSWAQEWNESGVGNFDTIAMSWVSGSYLESSTALSGFSAGGWTESDNGTATVAIASGPTTSNINFDTYFLSPQVTTTIDLYVFNGTTLVDSADVTWAPGGSGNLGYGWTYNGAAPPQSESALADAAGILHPADGIAVPLPASAGVGFAMLAGFGAVFATRKRLVRKAQTV